MKRSSTKAVNQALFFSCYNNLSNMSTPIVKTNYTMQKLNSIIDVNNGSTYLFVLKGESIGTTHFYAKVLNREIQGFTVNLVKTSDASLESFWRNTFKGIICKGLANSPSVILQYDKILDVYTLSEGQQTTLPTPKSYSHA